MNWKTSFSDNYFAYWLNQSLCWIFLVGSLFLLAQCGGGSSSSGGGSSGSGTVASSDNCKTEADDATDLTIVGTKVSSQRASIGDNLRVTVTIRNQGAATSGGAGSPQMVTFYRSSNKFISPEDEVLDTVSFGVLDPKEESEQSFPFIARAGDSYYGACLGTTNNCQIGVKVSIPSPDISGSEDYSTTCNITREGKPYVSLANLTAYTFYDWSLSMSKNLSENQEEYLLLKIDRKVILDIWTTGSEDMVALLFDGNCNPIVGHHYVEDGGIGGENNFQILATAEAGYYFLVVHEKSLNAADFGIKIKLDHPPRVIGGDPLYPRQWHLDSLQGVDINAPQAWEITRGCPSVLVAVVDTGVDISHPDLAPNHDDRYARYYRHAAHGTSVAGLIVAKGNNGLGVIGVAPEVGFVSLGVIGDSAISGSDAEKAVALLSNKEQTAISNNSWGLKSNGLFKPNSRAFQVALEEGVTSGYSGKGIFYAISGGNSHSTSHGLLGNVNYSVPQRYYSVAAICAVDNNGVRSSYSEKGANLWVCAPANSIFGGLTTTDVTGKEGYTSGDYIHDFGGTSASTPLVSGVAALMRSVNPELGWRDIRLILAATAQKNNSSNLGWFPGVASYDGTKFGPARYADTNTKYNHNHSYGFGLVNAEAAVSQSQNWNNVGQMVKVSSQYKNIPPAEQTVPNGDATGLSSVLKVTGINATLDFIEYIDIEIEIKMQDYGELQINLISPQNKTSILAERHFCTDLYMKVMKCVFSSPTKAFFGSARHLGESPDGDWTLKIIDEDHQYQSKFYSWGLKFYGHKKP